MAGAAHSSEAAGETRRDFINIAAVGFVAIGGAGAAWPFISQMNPAKDTLALASIEVDISKVVVGQSIKAFWRGKPVFIRRRTPEEIQAAADVDVATLPDPQSDGDRVKDVEGKARPEWLILVGVCTHLGCIPIGDAGSNGEYGGWFCPCHGSHYDTSGRIRKGPAPLNLEVPTYSFISDSVIRIG